MGDWKKLFDAAVKEDTRNRVNLLRKGLHTESYVEKTSSHYTPAGRKRQRARYKKMQTDSVKGHKTRKKE